MTEEKIEDILDRNLHLIRVVWRKDRVPERHWYGDKIVEKLIPQNWTYNKGPGHYIKIGGWVLE